MTRTDSFVVGILTLLLALVAGAIGIPSLQTQAAADGRSSPSAPGSPSASPSAQMRPYVEGVMGVPVSVSPLTAQNQPDRDLVALVFAGLVRNGPNGTIVPDMATRWSVDASGRTWTVELREDARWQDGEPLTSADVAFTIRSLQDPAYRGPAAGSWSEVTVRTVSARVVAFTLATPLAGFLQALTQPIAPAHLLADVPLDQLAEHPFGRKPVGSGPFALVSLTDEAALLEPATSMRPMPYLPGIEFRFYRDPARLAADYRDGTLDGASGAAPQVAAELGRLPGSRALRYPATILSAVVLNLRADHPEFRDARVRTALLAAIDRVGLIGRAYAGAASPANGPIPPGSPWFDGSADPPVRFDRKAARAALKAAGWTTKSGAWRLPKSTKALTLEVLSPDELANPALFAAAEGVVRDWSAIGLKAKHVALPPGEFVRERVGVGGFQVAVVDIAVGLDPDLYPLLASSQTVSGGSNVAGLQDPALDALLVAARSPGTTDQRRAAYRALQVRLAKGKYLLPLAFPDEVVVVRNTLEGPVVRPLADPSDRFWDVLTWRLAVDR